MSSLSYILKSIGIKIKYLLIDAYDALVYDFGIVGLAQVAWSLVFVLVVLFLATL